MKLRRLSDLYLIALHVGLVLAALRAGPIVEAVMKAGFDHPAYARNIESVRRQQMRMDAAVPAGAAVFLGDSITAGLFTAAVAPYSVNFGIPGQRSDHLLAGMGDYTSLRRAGRVFIMIGTNDLAQGRGEGLGDRYRAILARVPAGVPVTLSSPPPLERDMEGARAASVAARAACAADARCTFVDAFTGLSRPGMLAPDGVHLSARDYEAWIAMLKGCSGSGPSRPSCPPETPPPRAP